MFPVYPAETNGNGTDLLVAMVIVFISFDNDEEVTEHRNTVVIVMTGIQKRHHTTYR